jgi:hypothetical protein
MTFGTAFVINTLSKSQPDLNKKIRFTPKALNLN